MATSSTDFVTALGGGSGIDNKALSKALAEAQLAPRKTRLESQIDSEQRKTSGYAALSLALSNLKSAFDTLKDKSLFSGISADNSHEEYFTVTPGAGADAGSHQIQVTAIAAAQRSVSGGFSSSTTTLNAGNDFSLTFTFTDGTSKVVNVGSGSASVTGLVDAVNEAGIGVVATLVNTGSGLTPYQILLTGEEGVANGFVVGSDDGANPGSSVAELDFSTTLQAAADAALDYQGISITRSSNVIDDLIPGATLQLLKPTPIGEIGTTVFSRDTAAVRGKLTNLVEQYNQTMADIAILAGERSEDEEDRYSGSLNGDSLVRSIKSELRGLLTGDSSTPSGDLGAFWQLGLSVDRDGVASLNESTLDGALQSSFEDVRMLFSADTDDQSVYSSAAGGIAGDASKRLFELISYRGSIESGRRNSEDRTSTWQLRLEELEQKFDEIQDRYLRQFAQMESIVSRARAAGGSIVSSIGKNSN